VGHTFITVEKLVHLADSFIRRHPSDLFKFFFELVLANDSQLTEGL
jgi:hypothetical protein